MMKQPNKKLVLESGEEFVGYGFGADCPSVCDIVFNTSVVGYQEIISDPSYTDQIVVMTYPVIGNYGVADEDFETRIPSIGGLVVREHCETPSNFRSTKSIAELIEELSIPGIYGIDTRMLTRILRRKGCCRAAIVDASVSNEEALKLIADTPRKSDAVRKVSCRKRWYSRTPNHRFDVVVVDCGVKHNIIRQLNRCGCNVVIVPFDTPYEDIMAFNPSGVLISSGPGSPMDVPQVVDLICELRGKLPVFGIGLGYLLTVLAYGGVCCEEPCGNRRSNHPVKNLSNNHIEMAALSHRYSVDVASLKSLPLEATHIDMLDGKVVGVESSAERVFAVQHHPEGAPGPNDSTYLFDKFIKLMEA